MIGAVATHKEPIGTSGDSMRAEAIAPLFRCPKESLPGTATGCDELEIAESFVSSNCSLRKKARLRLESVVRRSLA